MRVKVKYFGLYRDIAGKMEEYIDGNFSRLSDLLKFLEDIYGSFRREYLVVSINYRYVENDANLKDGDEVAIMSPVSGG